MKLGELGEDRLVERITAGLPVNRSVVCGAGDDCAVVRSANQLLLLKTDCVVEGIHFLCAAKASAIGWKAMARPLSDFAAMSGVPQFALVTIIVPAETELRWITDLYRGLRKAARMFNVAIVGGETSRTDGPAAISVSMTGVAEKERLVRRSAGKPGDELFVTGRLGGSGGGKHLAFLPRIRESRWLTSQFSIHAMMDLSDGLGADLPRLAAASRSGFDLDEKAILRTRGCTIEQAISDGEDYELLFAISPQETAELGTKWKKKFPTLPLTRIGRLIPRSAFRTPHLSSGYAHFQKP